jgi:NACHT domain
MVRGKRGHSFGSERRLTGVQLVSSSFIISAFLESLRQIQYARARDSELLGPLTSDSEMDSPLNGLPYAIDAPFNAFNREDELPCLPNTRVDLLQHIYNWGENDDDKRLIFWLNGLAGTGKSTVARTVARRYLELGRLGASFFFSRGGGDIGRADKFVTTIAIQLARSIPLLQDAISHAVKERSDIASHALSDQWRQLVLRPLSQLRFDARIQPYILVIDALDECEGDTKIQSILGLLAEARSLNTVQLQIFLTSRPDTPIRHSLYQIPAAVHQDFILHNISPSIVDHDIALFLEVSLRSVSQEYSLGTSWPREETIKQLVQKSSGLFIWAATACRFIREGRRRRLIRNRLSAILQTGDAVAEPNEPEKHLNEIYITVLRHSIPAGCSKNEREELLDLLRYTLGSIVALLSPLSVHSLSRLLGILAEDINDSLEDLHAILDIPKGEAHPLRLHHPSFRDFLLDKSRCGDSNFWVDEKQAHQRLADRCVQILSTSLKEDICSVTIPGTYITDVERSRVDDYLPFEVQYACLYWIQHLQKSGAQLQDNDHIDQFLRSHFLHWLEALSWMQNISEGILEIISLESLALVSIAPNYLQTLN